MEKPAAMTAQELELAELMVASLNLDVAARDIEPDAPLYRDGLGLDSIDILEVALAISKTYGVHLKSDDRDSTRIFSSLRSLSAHVQGSRPGA
jgi:acyl carrier protein